jgi:hypothetical protein
MTGRFSLRNTAFLVALLVSAALYAHSLMGIASTGDELRSAVQAERAKRAVPVIYRSPDDSGDRYDCPASERAHSRVRL